MSYSLLGANERQHLFLWIELHSECPLVPVRHRHSEGELALIGGILVIGWIAGGLIQGSHNVLRRGQIGIANAEVNDIHAPASGLLLGFVYGGKEVGREVLYPIGIH